MALTKAVAGTAQARTLRGSDIDTAQIAEVTFFHDPTTAYDTALHGQIDAVPTLIQNSRRNGKTVTMRAVAAAQTAVLASDGTTVRTLASCAISGANVTYNVATSDWSTEATNGVAIGAQARPFSMLVTFTEA